MRTKNSLLATTALFLLASCGGGGGSTSSPTPTPPPPSPAPAVDTTPDSFTFASIENALPNTVIESETVTINGINAAANIRIVDGEFSIDGGDFTSTATTIELGQTIQVRLTTPNTLGETTRTTLTIGGVEVIFEVTLEAQLVTVTVNNNFKHIVGGIETFDRRKYINIHAAQTDGSWFDGIAGGNNAADDLITEFLDGFDVFMGRDTGPITSNLNWLTPEDPNRDGYADPAFLTSQGGNERWTYLNGTDERNQKARQHEGRNTDMIIGAQLHPFWPDGTNTSQTGWSFSQVDSPTEPFGTATGEYIGRYIMEYFNRGDGGDLFGQPLPKYIEVINEPLFFLYDQQIRLGLPPEDLTKIFEFHSTVARTIRDVFTNSPYGNGAILNNMLIGGYTAAFPDFDVDNFQRWNTVDKHFIDVAGNDMDFISIHTYDFPSFPENGNVVERYRKGSNMEATLDMLDHYTTLVDGTPKPLIVSEMGAAVHTEFDEPWDPWSDWQILKSMNSQMLQYMERPNTVAKIIPFILLKADFFMVDGIPSTQRLLRRENEPASNTGDWIYTGQVKFYDLWSDVRGTRVDTVADDLDIMVDAYVDGDTAHIVINNLDFTKKEISLQNLGLAAQNIVDITVEHLYWDGVSVQFDSQTTSDIPASIPLNEEATVVVKIDYDTPLVPDETSVERRVFASEMLKPITANQAINFTIDDVSPDLNGEAVLRLGIGRDHGLSLTPSITLNGTDVAVPSDWRGDDQFLDGLGRQNFFGVLEIPVPFSAIQNTNTLSVTFPDEGGQISTVALQVFDLSAPLAR